jgi:hypothetical protein
MLGRWLRQRGRWARLAMLLSAIACSPRTDAITSPNGLTLTAQSRLVAEPGSGMVLNRLSIRRADRILSASAAAIREF